MICKSKKYILVFLICFISCESVKNTVVLDNNIASIAINKKNVKVGLKNWHHKNFSKDSLPGIDLEKTYTDLIKKKKGEDFVVAFIDTSVDLNHEDFGSIFWNNKNEIPNNNLDDDGNGYTDDFYG